MHGQLDPIQLMRKIAELEDKINALRTIEIGFNFDGGIAGDYSWYIDGVLSVVTNPGEVFIVPGAGTIQAVYIHCKTQGSANSTIVDVNKNGTTIFTTQANRPSLAFNDADGIAKSGTPEIVTLAENDILTFDIDAVATNAAGLTVLISWISASGGCGADILEIQVFN